MKETIGFFNKLWPGGLPDGGNLVIVTKRGTQMVPKFFADIEAAARYAHREGQTMDAYFGVAAQPKVETGRGNTDTAMAVPGVWLDVDYEKGFRDYARAKHFLDALPLVPSIVVDSGGGLHVYWLFKEPYLIEGDDDRSYIKSITLGWLLQARKVASKYDATLDSVADLARIMRVPGTVNFKRSTPGASHLIEA